MWMIFMLLYNFPNLLMQICTHVYTLRGNTNTALLLLKIIWKCKNDHLNLKFNVRQGNTVKACEKHQLNLI